MSFVLLAVLAVARSFLTTRLLAARGESWQAPHGLGYLVASVVALPLLAVGVASLWRTNRNRGRLLMVANLAMFASVLLSVVQVASVQKVAVAPAAATATATAARDPNERVFQRDAWLADCENHCRRSAPQRLPTLSPAEREQHCGLSCQCGLEHMTDPGPGEGQVHAPSARWRAETDDQHRQGVTECLKQASDVVKAGHPG
jgi:hypothetical protein